MIMEFVRLAVGLVIAVYHRPIADYVLDQERSLVILLRQRGLAVPAAPTQETARTMYFCIGILMATFQLIHIYLLSRGLL